MMNETYKAGDLVVVLPLPELKEEIRKTTRGKIDEDSLYNFLYDAYSDHAGRTAEIIQVGYASMLGDCYFHLDITWEGIRWWRQFFRQFHQKQIFNEENE